MGKGRGDVLPGGRGVIKSLTDDRDGLWPHSPEAGGLDIHHRLPDLSVGLAASLRSMPTAVSEAYQTPSTGVDV
jgi:hypothetical protein